jgi:hypothetical protein
MAASGSSLLQPASEAVAASTAPPPTRHMKERRLGVAEAPLSIGFNDAFVSFIKSIFIASLMVIHWTHFKKISVGGLCIAFSIYTIAYGSISEFHL